MANLQEKLTANIEAIEIVLKNDSLPPTQPERDKLLLYAGFGDLKCILLDPTNPDEFSQSEKHLVPYVEKLHNTIRNYAPAQYEKYILSLKESVLTSFYTPPQIIKAIDDSFQLNRLSFSNVLDPSAGLGVFAALKGENFTFIEKDELTGKILQALNPDKRVIISGFEDIGAKLNNSFNLVASNIPFGNFKVFDPIYINSKNQIRQRSVNAIHTYFFEKGLDTLKDGGMLAFITSTGVMDGRTHQQFREHLLSRSHLISAVRLPENTFDTTKAQADLIVLQKDNQRYTNLTKEEQLFIETERLSDNNDVFINGLYADKYDRCIHTKATLGTNMYGSPEMRFLYDGNSQDIANAIQKIISKDIQQNTNRQLFLRYNKTEQTVANRPIQLSLFDDFVTPPHKHKEIFQFNNPVYHVAGSYQVNGNLIGIAKDATTAEVVDNNDKNVKHAISDYCRLRDAYFELKNFEIQNFQESTELRKELNRAYDLFINTPLGNQVFNRPLSISTFHQYILFEPSFVEVNGLEYIKDNQICKADIFFEPVAFARDKREYTPLEALDSSRNKLGIVDLDYIGRLAGISEEQLINKLEGKIFKNPVSFNYETADSFLSGNVVEKLEHSSRAIRSNPDDYQLLLSHEALKSVLPERIPFHDIGINLGERWIPEKYYNKFATQLFNTETNVYYNGAVDDFNVSASWNYQASQRFSVSTKSRNYAYYHVLEFALLDRIPDCTKSVYRNGEEIKVPDVEGIQKINAAISEIQAEWYSFANRLSESEKNELESIYNNKFNCFVMPKFDGSFQTFPDLDLKGLGFPDLYFSQKDAILRIKQQGGGIIDHEVGGGKTNIMIGAAYEMKRLGLCNKPVIIGMKANTINIAHTFEIAYPHAKILYASQKEFSKKERQEFFNKIQNNNWDCIIMTHDQFSQIPMSEEVKEKILMEERTKVIRSLNTLTDNYDTKRQKKLLELRLKNLEVKIKTVAANISNRKDNNVVDFATMGIDHIFCDESHKFKNLMFQTKHQRVAGLGNSTGSERAMNMKYALRTIQMRTGRDMGATFLSGTTVVNSLTELYCLFDYLRPQALQRQGIYCFDAWAATFTRKTKELEFGVTGELQFKERFREFVKVPELAKMYAEITDYKTADDIGIERPQKIETLVMLDKTDAQKDMFERLKQFAKSGDGSLIFRNKLTATEITAKMLIATNTSKKASIDMRLIDNQRFDETSANRTQAIADNAFSYYQRFNDQKGTQFIFSDLGVHNSNDDKFDVYSDIKSKLVNMGVPANEVVFVQDYKTDLQRDKLQLDMNLGKIRILIGSTEKAGTGINAQERCVAIHHVDIPWTPKDFEQRNGRGVRTNNHVARLFNNNNVDVFIYATKETLDVYKFNLVGNKDHFIKQIKNSSISVRTIDEGALDKDSGMSYKEYIAVLSGNQDLLDKAKIEKQISQFKIEEKIFYDRQRTRDSEIKKLQNEFRTHEGYLSKFKEDNKIFLNLKRNEKGNVVAEMIVGSQKFSSIKAFGEALNKELDQKITPGVYHKIGTYGEFGILLSAEKMKTEGGIDVFQNKLFIEGALKYSYNNGYVARNPITAGEYPQNALKRIGDPDKGLIVQYEKKNIEILKKINDLQQLSLSFPNKERLIEAEKQLREINYRLERTYKRDYVSDTPLMQEINYRFKR